MQLPKETFGEDGYVLEMIPRLSKQYNKTDPGVVVALITMNYLRLRPGQSIHVPADGIHAYLSGDIIECMTRSNNVLNTRFCPSADRNSVDMFCSVLTFPRSKSGKTNMYAPPMSEFNMLATEMGDGETESRDALGGPSIMIVTKGRVKMKAGGKEHGLDGGYVFFISVGGEIPLRHLGNCKYSQRLSSRIALMLNLISHVLGSAVGCHRKGYAGFMLSDVVQYDYYSKQQAIQVERGFSLPKIQRLQTMPQIRNFSEAR